jgi:2,3-oxidosqualene cyclase
MTSALDRGALYLISQQRENGCWEGEMVWCTMILSQYIIVNHIAGRRFDARSREQMVKHFRSARTPEGAWGLHRESGGYVFFTSLAYIALRLLGVSADDPLTSTARRWLHAQKGGVLAIPSWGKFWLAVLDLYGYDGVNPTPPEMFLLPKRTPFQPHRFYCHTRLIYMGLAYLYGSRTRADLGSLKDDLRKELYPVPYESIDFAAHRHDLAPTDVYVRPSRWLRFAYDALRVYEGIHSRAFRRRALDVCLRKIVAEQRTSRYEALSPVNGLLNCLALWSCDPKHPDLAPSLDGMNRWKWEDDAEGIRYVGARSNTWDTAFAMMGLAESPAVAQASVHALRRGYAFLRDAQMSAEIADYSEQGRDPALGGWCFSDGSHGWPVSDCTAEALSAMLKAGFSHERITEAVEFILYRQNADGGFGTYERRRGSSWLEAVNPSEMYGQCMTELSYIECTGSCIGALAHVRAAQPDLFPQRIDDAIAKGVRFLRTCQRRDGSYPGFWGINFTYGIFHAVRGLRAAGVEAQDPAVARAVEWLIGKQRPDGGWGEHYTSCLTAEYVEHSQSQVVMTSWALLALMEVIPADSEPVRQGIVWLEGQQCEDGSWPSQSVNGVFFGSAMLDYRLYKTYFPVWALARAYSAPTRNDC